MSRSSDEGGHTKRDENMNLRLQKLLSFVGRVMNASNALSMRMTTEVFKLHCDAARLDFASQIAFTTNPVHQVSRSSHPQAFFTFARRTLLILANVSNMMPTPRSFREVSSLFNNNPKSSLPPKQVMKETRTTYQ